jgi:hypothetical protein
MIPFAKLRGEDRAAALSALDSVPAIQGKIADAQAALKTLRAAPASREEMLAAVDAGLDRYAESARGAFDISGLFEADRAPRFSPRDLHVNDLVGLLVLTDRDLIRGLIVDRIDGALANRSGVDRAQRGEMIAQAEAALLDLELEEERTVRIAEAAGLAVQRRPDADPRAVLAEAP